MSNNPSYPGVYVEELPSSGHSIPGVSTSETAFVDWFASGPVHEAIRIRHYSEFAKTFGGLSANSEASYAIQQFFLNGGQSAWVVRVVAAHEPLTPEWIAESGADALLGCGCEGKGIYALRASGFNVLCLPAAARLSPAGVRKVYEEAVSFCEEQRAFLIVDVPPDVDSVDKAIQWFNPATNGNAITRHENAATYFPRLLVADPLNENQPRNIGASGTMAGLYARTDSARGVWKAPAGSDGELKCVELVTRINDVQNSRLNPLGINALRKFPVSGNVCWGARTLVGMDQLASEWKYIPVRRTALFIEESVYRGTQWARFEANDEVLWATIRNQVGVFMNSLFRQGAFQGRAPREAYFVRCDGTTNTAHDVEQGVINILIGFAPLKPAEFVTISIQQIAAHPLA